MEITTKGKITAGVLLILFSLAAIFLIMAYWPDRTPAIGKGDSAWYKCEWFNMELLDSALNKSKVNKETLLLNEIDSMQKEYAALQRKSDTSQRVKDSTQMQELQELIKEKEQELNTVRFNKATSTIPSHKIHFNSIILILVGLMGFLGNMIHIASSFTTFVGNETFKRSWVLWYFVKPFTAAGLAIIVYFFIRAGFFNYGSDASAVSLFGVLAFAAMAGLFTDKATLKLEEVFAVIFKSKDERKDKLEGDTLRIISVTPKKLDTVNTNKIVIKGENFSKDDMTIKINDVLISDAVITEKTIEFSYTVPAADVTKPDFVLQLIKTGKVPATYTWKNQ